MIHVRINGFRQHQERQEIPVFGRDPHYVATGLALVIVDLDLRVESQTLIDAGLRNRADLEDRIVTALNSGFALAAQPTSPEAFEEIVGRRIRL